MSIIDFSDTIIAKSDQLNAADIAGSITITITDAKKLQDPDQPVHIFYDGGGNKPWKPCKTMRRVIAQVWGSKVDLAGRSITLICDPKVTWGGNEVGGIRITHMSHMDKEKTLPLRVSKHVVQKHTVRPLTGVVKAASPEAPPELLEAGAEAAAGGVDTYKTWLATLTNDEKAPIKKHHAGWTEIAKAADLAKAEPDDGEFLI